MNLKCNPLRLEPFLAIWINSKIFKILFNFYVKNRIKVCIRFFFLVFVIFYFIFFENL